MTPISSCFATLLQLWLGEVFVLAMREWQYFPLEQHNLNYDWAEDKSDWVNVVDNWFLKNSQRTKASEIFWSGVQT